jgi:flagellar biosynthesis protein FliQ
MEYSIQLIQQSLFILLIYIAPLFLILLIVGILISILQAMFQIHEGSILYVSKLSIAILYFFVVGRDFYNNLMSLIINIFNGR